MLSSLDYLYLYLQNHPEKFDDVIAYCKNDNGSFRNITSIVEEWKKEYYESHN